MAFPSGRYYGNRASDHTVLDRWVKGGFQALGAPGEWLTPPMTAVHTWPQVSP